MKKILNIIVVCTFMWTNCVWACNSRTKETLAAQSMLRDAVGQLRMYYAGAVIHSELVGRGGNKTLMQIYEKMDEIEEMLLAIAEEHPVVNEVIPDLENLMCLVSSDEGNENKIAYYYFSESGFFIRITDSEDGDVRDRIRVALAGMGREGEVILSDSKLLCVQLWSVEPWTMDLINSFLEEFYPGKVRLLHGDDGAHEAAAPVAGRGMPPESGGSGEGFGCIIDEFLKYDDLEFCEGWDVKCNLGNLASGGKAFTKENDALADLLNDSLAFLQEIARENEHVKHYLGVRFSHPDNADIVVRVSSNLPLNAIRYFNQREKRVEVILNENFAKTLITTYDAGDQTPKQLSKNIAIKTILAERLFHEFGHRNKLEAGMTSDSAERLLIIWDCRLHRLVKRVQEEGRTLQEHVEEYFNEEKRYFPSGYYFEFLDEILWMSPGSERDRKILEFLNERTYWGIGRFLKSKFREKMERFMGVDDIVEAQRYTSYKGRKVSELQRRIDRRYAERLAKSALKQMHEVITSAGYDYNGMTQQNFNKLFGVRPIVAAVEHGEPFSGYIHNCAVTNGQGKTDVNLAVEASYCSPGVRPVVGIDDKLLGLIVKDEYIEGYDFDGHRFKVMGQVVSVCLEKKYIPEEYLDEGKVKKYFGVDKDSVQIVFSSALDQGKLFMDVALNIGTETPYSQVVFGKMASAALLDKTNASFMTYLALLSGRHQAAVGGKISEGEIKGTSNFLMSGTGRQVTEVGTPTGKTEARRVIGFADWHQMPHIDSSGEYDRVAQLYGEEQRELEGELEGWDGMDDESRNALRNRYPWFVISDDGELLCQENLLHVREEIKEWNRLSAGRREELKRNYAIKILYDENGKESGADLLIGTNTAIFSNELLKRIAGMMEREYERNGFKKYEDSGGSVDNRKPGIFWGVDPRPGKRGKSRLNIWPIIRVLEKRWRREGGIGSGTGPFVAFVDVGYAPSSLRTTERQFGFTDSYLEQVNKPAEFVPVIVLNNEEEGILSEIRGGNHSRAIGYLRGLGEQDKYRTAVRRLLIAGYMEDSQHRVLEMLVKLERETGGEPVLSSEIIRGINESIIVEFIDRGWLTTKAITGRESDTDRLICNRIPEIKRGDRDMYIARRIKEVEHFSKCVDDIMRLTELDRKYYGFAANLVRLYGRKKLTDLETDICAAVEWLGIEVSEVITGLFFNQDIGEMKRIYRKIVDKKRTKKKRVLAFGGGTGLRVTTTGLGRHYYVTSVQGSIDDGGSSYRIVKGLLDRGYGRIPTPGDIVNSLYSSFAGEDKMNGLLDDTGRVVLENNKIAIKERRDGRLVTLATANSYSELVGILLKRILDDKDIKKGHDWPFFATTMLNLARLSEMVYFDTGIVPLKGASIRNMTEAAAADCMDAYGPDREEVRRAGEIEKRGIRGTTSVEEPALDTPEKVELFQSALDIIAVMAGIYDAGVTVSHTEPGTVYAEYKESVLVIEYEKGKFKEVVVSVLPGAAASVEVGNGIKVEIKRTDSNKFRFKLLEHSRAITDWFKVEEENGKPEDTYLYCGKKYRLSNDGTGRYIDEDVKGADRHKFLRYGDDGLMISVQGRFVVCQTNMTERLNFSRIEDFGLIDRKDEGHIDDEYYEKGVREVPVTRNFKPAPERKLSANQQLLIDIEKDPNIEAIVFGPGSVFTSLIPHLMVEGIIDKLVEFRGKGKPVVFIANPFVDNETHGYNLREIIDFIDGFIRRYSAGRYGFTDVFSDVIANHHDIDIMSAIFKETFPGGMKEEDCVDKIIGEPQDIFTNHLNTTWSIIRVFLMAGFDKNYLIGSRKLGVEADRTIRPETAHVYTSKMFIDFIKQNPRCQRRIVFGDDIVYPAGTPLRDVLLGRLHDIMSKTDEKIKVGEIRMDKGMASRAAKKARGRISPDIEKLEQAYPGVLFHAKSFVTLGYSSAREAGALRELVVGYGGDILEGVITGIIREGGAQSQPSQITREERREEQEEVPLCTLTIDERGEIVNREVHNETEKSRGLYNEGMLEDVIGLLRQDDDYGEGIFKLIKKIYIYDNYMGLRKGEKGPTAVFKDGEVFIDIDAFRNRWLLFDPVEHEMLKGVLNFLYDNEGFKEVVAVYRNVKRFLNPKVVDAREYQREVLEVLKSPDNGLDPSGDYARMLERLLGLQSGFKDDEDRDKKVISAVVTYILTTSRYEHLKGDLGVRDDDEWQKAVGQAEERMEAVLDIYDNLMRAKRGGHKAVSEGIISQVKEKEEMSIRTIRTFKGMRIEGLKGFPKILQRMIGVIAKQIHSVDRFEQLVDDVPQKKYLLADEDRLRAFREAIGDEEYRRVEGDLRKNNYEICPELPDEAQRDHNVIRLVDPSDLKGMPREEGMLYLVMPYTRSSLFMAADIVGVGEEVIGGSLQNVNSMVKGLIIELYSTIIGSGFSEPELLELLTKPWVFDSEIQRIGDKLDTLTIAALQIEKSA